MSNPESFGSVQPATEPPTALIAPYGGPLIDLVAASDEREQLSREATELASLQISPRSLCDLELLAVGAFSPLTRFLSRADYLAVLESMRLADGTLFPIPITLPVGETSGLPERLALRSPTNHLIAILTVEEVFERDQDREALKVCGTTAEDHPLVAEMQSWGKFCLSGALRVLELPRHYDSRDLRRSPVELRRVLQNLGRSRVVAFEPAGPIHRGDEAVTKQAAGEIEGTLLIHPAVGAIRPGDVEHFTRVQTYKTLVERHYDSAATVLSLLPLATRLAGPREAVWHAIIRRNYGASHLMVGPDYASPPGAPRFYGPQDAQKLAAEFASETGVSAVLYDRMVYLPAQDRYEQVSRLPENASAFSLSERQISDQYLAKGDPLPDWFTRPDTAAILAKAHPPKTEQGLCVWFTGLPSAGKSTIAEILSILLLEHGRRVTMLDGDVVRTHLSKGLGFSREDRDVNIRRLGFVASEIVRHGGTVLCAAVSPFNATRNQVRDMVGPGHFILAYVSTPATVCEDRDVKGFYAKARAGELKHFTGVDDPYEEPLNPDVFLETVSCTPEENAARVLESLRKLGFVRG